jgi:hypothetical protein
MAACRRPSAAARNDVQPPLQAPPRAEKISKRPRQHVDHADIGIALERLNQALKRVALWMGGAALQLLNAEHTEPGAFCRRLLRHASRQTMLTQ